MNGFASWFSQRRKAIFGLVGIAVTIAAQHFGATNEYVVMAIGALAVIGIHEVPNDPNELQNVLADIRDIFSTANPKPLPAPVVSPTPLAPLPEPTGLPVEHWGDAR